MRYITSLHSAAMAVAAGAVLATPMVAAAQPARYEAAKDALAQAVAAKSVVGAIVLIKKDGKTVMKTAQGRSDVAMDSAMLKEDSIVWIASMTKPTVATAVLMMVDAGKVKLDDPVSKYVPEFAKPRQVRSLKPGASLPPPGPPGSPAPAIDWDYAPATRALTVHDIITMTAGLQTIRVPSAVPSPGPTDNVETYVAKLGDAPLDFQPGSRWGYSNATEFEVAARIVEVASGQTFGEFMKQHVFGPLDMKDTSFGNPADKRERVAPVPAPGPSNNPLASGRFTSGSAGLWSTAEDYSHFAQMLLNGGVYNGKRLLKASTVKAMTSNQIGKISLGGVGPGAYGGIPATTNDGVKYGYGTMVIVDPAKAGVAVPLNSFGWDGVGSRRWWVAPSSRTVLIMLTLGGPRYDDVQRTIERAVFTGK